MPILSALFSSGSCISSPTFLPTHCFVVAPKSRLQKAFSVNPVAKSVREDSRASSALHSFSSLSYSIPQPYPQLCSRLPTYCGLSWCSVPDPVRAACFPPSYGPSLLQPIAMPKCQILVPRSKFCVEFTVDIPISIPEEFPIINTQPPHSPK